MQRFFFKALKKGSVIAKQVFRGRVISEDKVVKSAYSPDWALVPKVGIKLCFLPFNEI